jgi:hypothetical protein
MALQVLAGQRARMGLPGPRARMGLPGPRARRPEKGRHAKEIATVRRRWRLASIKPAKEQKHTTSAGRRRASRSKRMTILLVLAMSRDHAAQKRKDITCTDAEAQQPDVADCTCSSSDDCLRLYTCIADKQLVLNCNIP